MSKVKTVDYFSEFDQQDKDNLWDRLNKGIDKNNGTGCWEWTKGKFKAGYGQISLNRDGRNYNLKTHRIAYQIVHNDPLNGKLIRHLCNNYKCCNPEHLMPGTHLENTRDSIEVKSHAFYKYDQSGSGNFNAALTEEDVILARELYSSGDYTQKQVADLFGVSRRCIGRAIVGTHYSNINDKAPPTDRTVSDKIKIAGRLTGKAVYEIVKAYALDGYSADDLCEKYDCNKKLILRILRGERHTVIVDSFYKEHPNARRYNPTRKRYCKLDKPLVFKILDLLEEGLEAKSIIERLNLQSSAVYGIKSGNYYKDHINEYYASREHRSLQGGR